MLVLELSYEWYHGDGEHISYMTSEIWCERNFPNSRQIETVGVAVSGFIKNGQCLDLGPDVSDNIYREGYILEGNECGLC